MPERTETHGFGGGQYMSNYDSVFHLETHADKVIAEDESNYRQVYFFKVYADQLTKKRLNFELQASRCLTELMKRKNYFDRLSSELSSASYVCDECKSSLDALLLCMENLLYRHILQVLKAGVLHFLSFGGGRGKGAPQPRLIAA
jgi:hypothetical protein